MYNNEAIGIIAISSVMQHSEQLTVANALLILPFVFHPTTASSLSRTNTKLRSIEEFVTKYPGLFSNFADRYESLLPVTINSIVTSVEAGIIKIEGNKIVPSTNFNEFTKTKHSSKRAIQIIKASENLSLLLQDKSVNLYLHLRIKL